MRDLVEELKELRNSPPKEALKIDALEAIAELVSDSEYCTARRKSALVSRLRPSCYTSFEFNNVNVNNLHEETLFYIFYALTESEIQIKAYNCLINKGYFFSRQLEGFVMLCNSRVVDNKKRNILLFDPWIWEKVNKEVVFDDKFINSLESVIPEI